MMMMTTKVTVAAAVICILMPLRALGRKSPFPGQSSETGRGMHGGGGGPTYGVVRVRVVG